MTLGDTIRKAIYNYDRAPDILKYQLELLSSELSKDKRVEPEYNVWKREYENINFGGREISGKELRKLLLHACIFRYISALRVSEPDRFGVLECYNEMAEPIIRLQSILTEGAYVKVFKGKFIHEKYSNGYGLREDSDCETLWVSWREE